MSDRRYELLLQAAKSVLEPHGLDSRDQAAAIADLEKLDEQPTITNRSDAELYLHACIEDGSLAAWVDSPAIYTVNGDADALEGWTAAELATALSEPLAEIGVTVECRPNERGASINTVPAELVEDVQRVVERVTTEGQ